MVLATAQFPVTSVTRSRISGNAFIGSTVISPSNLSTGVLHMSLGISFISAEHDPHLPALQFQRVESEGSRWLWM